jgi:sigma-B regulation protein RsbU (phosphoserine phosphatase)
MAEEVYQEHVQSGVKSGQLILAATDGIWETTGEGDALYGMDRLHEFLRKNAHRPAAEISEVMRDSLARFRGPMRQDDDLTFVIVRVL